MAVFPTLDFMQIKARYPKAVQKITDWLFSQPELQSATEGFIDINHPEESKEQFTGLMIQMDPRKLYDIFDSLGICVSVYKDGETFWYNAEETPGEAQNLAASSRHTAEVSAFYDAFELLEKQL